MSLKKLIETINHLNNEVSKSDDLAESTDNYIDEYSNSKTSTNFVLLDLNRNLKPDIINYNKLVKNNIALCNTILQKLDK